MNHRPVFLACLVGLCSPLHAGVTIDGGFTEVFLGEATTIQIPVQVLGGDAITDMVGAVEIAGASITGVSYVGSVWEAAPGGRIDFFPGFSPSGETVDPNISLMEPGESVVADGILFTLTVDISGLDAGDHAVKLTETGNAGNTAVYLNGVAPTTTVTDGTLRITKKPIDVWRETHFPAEVGNATLEATVWGDAADPDGDGLENLAEFAMGLDPNDAALPVADATAPGVPGLVFVDDGGQEYAALKFSRRIERPCHEVVVEVSADLQIWDDTPAATVEAGTPVTLPGGEFELVTQRLTETISPGAAARFLRLKVVPLSS